jgi:4'-phosphopantetheinyl transferase EntD
VVAPVITANEPQEAENPAQLSVELAGLFPPGVVAAELPGNAPVTLLTASERRSISHCAHKRIEDFTAGRACAHRALRELGITGFSLLSGPDRQPLWPASIRGSITHTNGFRAAVVAHERDVRGVGLDCESIEAVDEELWPRICTPAELRRLASSPAEERTRQAALIFAAKEAFYKCQYPLTQSWVGFEDVAIEPASEPGDRGAFSILPLTTLALAADFVRSLVARFSFRDRWVIAAVAIPAAANLTP